MPRRCRIADRAQASAYPRKIAAPERSRPEYCVDSDIPDFASSPISSDTAKKTKMVSAYENDCNNRDETNASPDSVSRHARLERSLPFSSLPTVIQAATSLKGTLRSG